MMLGRLHAVAADQSRMCRRRRGRRRRLSRNSLCVDAVNTPAEKTVMLCSSSGRRTDDVDAVGLHQFADLLHGDLGLAARRELADDAVDHDGLGLDRVGDAEPLDQADEIKPARAGLGMGDRFRRQQRDLERRPASRCRASARPLRTAIPTNGAREVGAAPRILPCAIRSSIAAGGEHGDVAGLARGNALASAQPRNRRRASTVQPCARSKPGASSSSTVRMPMVRRTRISVIQHFARSPARWS